MSRLPKSPRVVITGAGSGFGRALAIQLAKTHQARLLLSDRVMATVEETARLALDAGAREARAIACDVTSLADVEALAKASDGVDLIVNNAGVSSGGAVGESPMADWRWVIDVDLFGVIHGCHVFVPLLRKQGFGHVLNVASAAGLLAAPKMGAYNVAKAGVVSLSETLFGELRGTGIGVTCLCPTFFQTNIARDGRFADERIKASAARLVDKGITAEEVAKLAIQSVEAGDLYCLPMADARWMWRLKRAVPSLFPVLAHKAARRLNLL